MSYDFCVPFFGAAAVPGPPPPPSKPMDAFLSGMHEAYGLKQVLGAYTGPLVRVRRSSDNAEQDIGYVSGGGLDTTALASFVGSGDGFVTKLYGQKLTVDAVQTVTTKQPKIVSAGTYLGTIKCDGVDDYLISHTPAVVALSFAAMLRLPVAPGSGSASYFSHAGLATSGNNGLACQYQSNNTATNSYIFTGTSSYSHQPAVFSTTYTSMMLVANRGHYPPTYYADGAARGGSPDTTGTPTSAAFTDQDLYIGSNGGTQPAAIEFSEFVIWTVDHSADFFSIFGAL